MKTAVASVILLAILLQVGAAQALKRPTAKPKPPAKENPKPEGPPETYSTAPFDPNLSTLPTEYRGHDAKRIYDALAKSLADKGEFETTKAYQERIDSVPSTLLVGELTASHIFAFEIDRTIYDYDADKELLRVGVELGPVYKGVKPINLHQGLVLSSGKGFAQKIYEGTNALGAKVAVTRDVTVQYALAVENWNAWRSASYGGEMTRISSETFEYVAKKAFLDFLNLEPAKAQRLKPNFRLLAVCRLKFPHIGSGGSYIEPTFNDPRETVLANYYLYVDLLELWAYDSSSGQVLYKRQN
jgi:hypothetical protein